MKLLKALISIVLVLGVVFGVYTRDVQSQQAVNEEVVSEAAEALDAQIIPEEKITSYNVELIVEQGGMTRVTEQINYDFGELQRHGIFRNITYKYKTTNGRFKLRISDIVVSSATGAPSQFTEKRSGDDVVLKIGDPDRTITGTHQYTISYSVERAINFFNTHNELYWNAIGTEWDAPILQASAAIKTPEEILDTDCFVGSAKSTESNCDITEQGDGTVAFISQQQLEPNQGMTIVASLPAGTIAQPSTEQKIKWFIADNGILALPLAVLLIMFSIWYKIGRDYKGSSVVTTQYDAPEGISPLYVGTLIDSRLDSRDISAEIIYLAVNGYLKIERQEVDRWLYGKKDEYQFTKVKSIEVDSAFAKQTKKLYTALFAKKKTVKLSEFKKDKAFGKAMQKLRPAVYKDLTSEGYYRKNPNTIKGAFVGVGIFVGFFSVGIVSEIFGGAGTIASIASGVIIALFGSLMPAKTKKGTEINDYILGLKQYIAIAEKDRIDFHNAPNKNPQKFEELLPYAMAFGVEKEWAKQFEGLYTQQPSWYSDASGSSASLFNAALLSSSIGNFSNSFNSAVSSVSTASSGGSGFSGGGVGGGGGGGGGGSW